MQWMIAGLVSGLLVASTGCQESSPEKPSPPAPVAKTTDDCKLFLTKARTTMQNLSKAAGVSWTESMETTAIEDCRNDLKAGKRAKLNDCVLAAKDEPAVQGCFPRYEELVDGKLGSAKP